MVDFRKHMIMSGKLCAYCEQPTVYVDSAEVYNGRSYGMVYLCRPCQAWVGVHKGTDKALGRTANAELRHWKKQAHGVFDGLWRRKAMHALAKKEYADPEKSAVWSRSRNAAYAWLSEKTAIPPSECHIGMMDIDQCKLVIGVCQVVIDNINKPQSEEPGKPNPK